MNIYKNPRFLDIRKSARFSNKTIIAMAGIALGISCIRDAPVAYKEQAVEHGTAQETQTPEGRREEPASPAPYHVVEPIDASYAEVWSNHEQLRVSVYGNDINGNKAWELRWSRFENSSRQCLFEQFYATDYFTIRNNGLWEIVVTDNECNGSVESVVEFFNRKDIADEITWEGINEHMAYVRGNVFAEYPFNLEEQIENWHERNAKIALEKQ